MRVLVDENQSPLMAEAVRSLGHAVEVIAGTPSAGSDDPDVLEGATAEDAIVLTADSDFGTLRYKDRLDAVGVIFLRFHVDDLSFQVTRVLEFMSDPDREYAGWFWVVRDGDEKRRSIDDLPA